MALLIGTHTGSTVLRKQYVGCREGGGPKMGRLVTHSCQHRDQSVHLSVPNTKSDFFFPSMIWMTLFTLMSHIYKKILFLMISQLVAVFPLLKTINNCSDSSKRLVFVCFHGLFFRTNLLTSVLSALNGCFTCLVKVAYILIIQCHSFMWLSRMI